MFRPRRGPRSYFTEFTAAKAIFYMVAGVYVVSVSILVLLQPLMTFECDLEPADLEFGNPLYEDDPCRLIRRWRLLGLTVAECNFGRRLVMAVLLGSVIGWERRQSERPAGIRTMCLVALGSCLFSICSAFAFLDGPMEWDASRVAAAIPSGVGFLGAGLIFKHDQTGEEGERTHTVHGLTTAASLWLSAAVGIACSGELFFVASYSVAIMLLVLRFGPRLEDSDAGSGMLFEDPELQPINASFRNPKTPDKAPQIKS